MHHQLQLMVLMRRLLFCQLLHQIRYLEKKLEVILWEKEGRNLRLTQAGELLLRVAQQILPVLQQTEETLKAYGEGRQGILRIGVECYPCSEWLNGVIGSFLQDMPDVEIEIVNKFQFSGLEGLLNHHIDMLVTPDLEKNKNIHYETIAKYELVLLVSSDHELSKIKTLTPEKLAQETLLTFPVPLERLDILTYFLNPACLKPAKLKEIESIDLMLQMVSLGRGVCVIPEWLADNIANHGGRELNLTKHRIGQQGLHKQLFLARRMSDRDIAYIERFIEIGKAAADRIF